MYGEGQRVYTGTTNTTIGTALYGSILVKLRRIGVRGV